MASKRPIATRRTVRLRKVECSAGCDYHGRYSLAMLRRGLPGCGECGAPCWPAELEDAVELLSEADLRSHPAWLEYERECSSVAHGQAWTGRRSDTLRPVETVAAERIHDRERMCAVQRRLAALKGPDSAREAMPF